MVFTRATFPVFLLLAGKTFAQMVTQIRSASNCSSVELIHVSGTFDYVGLGLVGTPLSEELLKVIPAYESSSVLCFHSILLIHQNHTGFLSTTSLVNPFFFPRSDEARTDTVTC